MLPEGIEIIGGIFSQVEAGLARSMAAYSGRSNRSFRDFLPNRLYVFTAIGTSFMALSCFYQECDYGSAFTLALKISFHPAVGFRDGDFQIPVAELHVGQSDDEPPADGSCADVPAVAKFRHGEDQTIRNGTCLVAGDGVFLKILHTFSGMLVGKGNRNIAGNFAHTRTGVSPQRG